MDTFSLTNSGGNQSWSMTLKNKSRIIWIFVRIAAGTYDIDVFLNGAIPKKCLTISQPVKKDTEAIDTILTCPHSIHSMNDKIAIKNTADKPLKINEVHIIGISQINPKRIQNFSDYTHPISKALDNNIVTHYTPHETTNASWFMELDAIYLMKWFLISIRGGTFELHIAVGKTFINSSTLCMTFNFPGLQQHQAAIECINATRGDTVVVKKIDQGSLRLFELIPIICSPNYFGPNCAKCQQKCLSCDPISGKCTQCHSSLYGEYCQHNCPPNCLDLLCNPATGVCNGCKIGFKGNHCEQEMTSLGLSTGLDNTSVSDKTTLVASSIKSNCAS